jgi:hypothetical protein
MEKVNDHTTDRKPWASALRLFSRGAFVTGSVRRSFLVSIAVYFCLGIVYLLFAPNYDWQSQRGDDVYGADFLQEWVGARLILDGRAEDLYTSKFLDWQHDPELIGFEWDKSQFYPAVYPPPHYVLFTPLALLPYRWAAVVWLMMLLASACSAAWTIASLVKQRIVKSDEEGRNTCDYLWMGALLFPSMLFSITLGQKSAVWLLLLSVTAYLLLRSRDYLSGFVFGLLTVKPTLCFLLPLLMLKERKWNFLAGMMTSCLLLWGVAATYLPWSVWPSFADGFRSAGNYAENAGYRMEWSCNLLTLAYGLPLELVPWCKWGICLPLGIYVFFGAITETTDWKSPRKWMIIAASTVLLSPHFYHYDLCVLLIPILWLIATEPERGFAYFAMLSVGVVLAGDAVTYLRLPILPLMLVGIVCELRLSGVLHGSSQYRSHRLKNAIGG